MRPAALADGIDTTLLRGFRYACRPGCGLCCFATPRVEREERAPLLQLRPPPQIDERPGGSFLSARPEGGACTLLQSLRCAAWEVRPRACRRFPLAVHLGERLQADLVLTCPGVDLAPLLDGTPWASRPAPIGLDPELAAARDLPAGRLVERWTAAVRRHRRIRRELERAGRWQEAEEVRAALRGADLLPASADFPVDDPPSIDDGLELLPLVFDGGTVALAAGPEGWEVVEIAAEGGVRRRTAVAAPDRPPGRSGAADRLLAGYLRYCLERDSFLAAVEWALDPEGTHSLVEATLDDLRALGAQIVARADVLRRARGDRSGPLSIDEVAAGIRATDQDWLDRPTWGERL